MFLSWFKSFKLIGMTFIEKVFQLKFKFCVDSSPAVLAVLNLTEAVLYIHLL